MHLCMCVYKTHAYKTYMYPGSLLHSLSHMHVNAHTYVYFHKHIHICLHAHTHTHKYTSTHTYIHTYIPSSKFQVLLNNPVTINTYIHTYIHTCSAGHSQHPLGLRHTQRKTPIRRSHTHIHTYIHTYIHTCNAGHSQHPLGIRHTRRKTPIRRSSFQRPMQPSTQHKSQVRFTCALKHDVGVCDSPDAPIQCTCIHTPIHFDKPCCQWCLG
jgi:hypothetical protein